MVRLVWVVRVVWLVRVVRLLRVVMIMINFWLVFPAKLWWFGTFGW